MEGRNGWKFSFISVLRRFVCNLKIMEFVNGLDFVFCAYSETEQNNGKN